MGDQSMNIQLPVLKVQMLGGLSLMYGEEPISFRAIRPQKR